MRTPGGLKTRLFKLAAVAALHARGVLMYPREIVADSAFVALTMFIFSNLWRTVGAHQDLVTMTSLNLERLIWYLAFTEAIYMSTNSLPDGMPVDREVRTGDIAYRFVRPIGYASFHLAAHLGERVASFGLRLMVTSAVAWLLVGWPGLSAGAVRGALVSALFCFFADATWTYAIAFLSFWVEDTYGLHLLYRRAMMVLGGVLVPLAAYPEWARQIAEVLPFRLLIDGPSRMFVAADSSGIWSLLGFQAGWGLLGCLPLVLLYRRGVVRLGAQGG
ncbi:MAG: hypothetical protein H6729_06905 [Deltaproteobacteria bacterium]|nr:hypothetical protein [Deltaproteobacteria bacterium]